MSENSGIYAPTFHAAENSIAHRHESTIIPIVIMSAKKQSMEYATLEKDSIAVIALFDSFLSVVQAPPANAPKTKQGSKNVPFRRVENAESGKMLKTISFTLIDTSSNVFSALMGRGGNFIKSAEKSPRADKSALEAKMVIKIQNALIVVSPPSRSL